MPRPSKLSDQVRLDLTRSLVTGADAETAARAAGISLRTLQRWLQRARELREREDDGKRIRKEDRPYLELLDSVEQADAQVEVRLLGLVQRAAQERWQAAAWMLERRWPEKYAGPRRKMGRPVGSSSAPDRPSSQPPPPRVRLRAVK